jgi:hypothetical protein
VFILEASSPWAVDIYSVHQKSPFYGIWRFTTVITKACHWTLSRANSIQFTSLQYIFLWSILILSSHLLLGLQSEFHLPPMHATFSTHFTFWFYHPNYRSQGSSVSIVSDYVLDDRGSISNWQRIFPLAFVSRPALGPTQPPVQGYWGSFPQG